MSLRVFVKTTSWCYGPMLARVAQTTLPLPPCYTEMQKKNADMPEALSSSYSDMPEALSKAILAQAYTTLSVGGTF